MIKSLATFTFLVLSCAFFRSSVSAEDWTRFRGLNGKGVSESTSLPTSWSDSENIAWKIELPGAGSSSPVVSGDRIFVTCYSGYGIGREGSAEKLLDRKSVV